MKEIIILGSFISLNHLRKRLLNPPKIDTEQHTKGGKRHGNGQKLVPLCHIN